MEADPRYDSFDTHWSNSFEPVAHVMAGGDVEYLMETFARLAAQSGPAHAMGLARLLYMLPSVGGAEEARAIADEALAAASDHGNPVWIIFALAGQGRAFADTDSDRALNAFHQALAQAEQHRVVQFEARVPAEAAGLEAIHGDLAQAMKFFDKAVNDFHRAGNQADLVRPWTLATPFNSPDSRSRSYRPNPVGWCHDRGPSVRHGDVFVHRHRGFDVALGERPSRHVGGVVPSRRDLARSVRRARRVCVRGGWRRILCGVRPSRSSNRGRSRRSAEPRLRAVARTYGASGADGFAYRRGPGAGRNYFGSALNHVGQLHAVAHRGQIDVSDATESVVPAVVERSGQATLENPGRAFGGCVAEHWSFTGQAVPH